MMEAFVERIDGGRELLGEIARVTGEKGLRSSWILGAIGALDRAELGVYDPQNRKYDRFSLEGHLELVSSQGNVSEDGGVHMHCTIGEGEHTFAGHLMSGHISIFVEIAFLKLDVRLGRKAINGVLKELRVDRRGS